VLIFFFSNPKVGHWTVPGIAYLNTRNEQEEQICVFGEFFVQKLWQESERCIFASEDAIMEIVLLLVESLIIDIYKARFVFLARNNSG
jgi:hypothetical protein